MRVKSTKFNWIICSILLIIIWALTIVSTNLYCQIQKGQLALIEEKYKTEVLLDKLEYMVAVDRYIFQENNVLFETNQELQQKEWQHSKL